MSMKSELSIQVQISGPKKETEGTSPSIMQRSLEIYNGLVPSTTEGKMMQRWLDPK